MGTDKDLIRQVEANRDTLLMLETMASGDVPSADVLEDHGLSVVDDWMAGFDNEVLEVVVLRRNADIDALELLMAYGGPTVRATIRENGHATITGYWGTDEHEVRAHVPILAGYLFGVEWPTE